jgi:putative FmdB family regulatory protein
MPIYEYRCQVCGAVSEFLTGLGQPEEVVCRECGSSKMEKLMSVMSFTTHSPQREAGHTCCGREERCETPPCSSGGGCRRESSD